MFVPYRQTHFEVSMVADRYADLLERAIGQSAKYAGRWLTGAEGRRFHIRPLGPKRFFWPRTTGTICDHPSSRQSGRHPTEGQQPDNNILPHRSRVTIESIPPTGILCAAGLLMSVVVLLVFISDGPKAIAAGAIAALLSYGLLRTPFWIESKQTQQFLQSIGDDEI